MNTLTDTSRRTRIAALLAVLALLLAACAGSKAAPATPSAGSPSSAASGPVALLQIPGGPHENVPSALTDPTAVGLPKPLVDPALILSGGPPPDGIPAIDHPKFVHVNEAPWIHAEEPVLAFSLNGQDRAYPVQILIWHEIVNDTVAGVPVSVTFCPLCDSALAFDRKAAGRVLSFGTSGELYNSDLVMYDRQTQSLWPQLQGQAVAGVLTGTQLTAYPVQMVSWLDWRLAHPNGWVLSRDTGFSRSYGYNPYPGYDNVNSPPILFSGKTDGRFAPKTRVVGLRAGADAVAVTYDALGRTGVIETPLNGQPVVVWLLPGTASPLDQGYLTLGRDVGASGAFSPLVGGRHLHFTRVEDGFRDTETGSVWNVLGHAVSGPLAGSDLQPVAHVDSFWFAWAAFVPASRVVS